MATTKEDLIRENRRLESNNMGLNSKDERLRKEFAKAFGWWDENTRMPSFREENKIPSWDSVFVQLGKLLQTQRVVNENSEIHTLKRENQHMRDHIEKLNNKQ